MRKRPVSVPASRAVPQVATRITLASAKEEEFHQQQLWQQQQQQQHAEGQQLRFWLDGQRLLLRSTSFDRAGSTLTVEAKPKLARWLKTRSKKRTFPCGVRHYS
mmetsp:Transcript_43944/g.87159  ORF Transcript_43944/g.87159 Transcript_43944/m.87159 type:complete len:104 (+) Transcript_43944:58-369(+)